MTGVTLRTCPICACLMDARTRTCRPCYLENKRLVREEREAREDKAAYLAACRAEQEARAEQEERNRIARERTQRLL